VAEDDLQARMTIERASQDQAKSRQAGRPRTGDPNPPDEVTTA